MVFERQTETDLKGDDRCLLRNYTRMNLYGMRNTTKIIRTAVIRPIFKITTSIEHKFLCVFCFIMMVYKHILSQHSS
jgi:hypothetical protein